MERGGAANHNLAAGTKRPPPELDGTTNNGDWTGTKRTKELHEHQQVVDSVGGGRTGLRKRPFEHDELEPDVEFEKLYKCNYWEDPAHVSRINFFGLGLARNAAFDNHCERLHQQAEAWLAEQQALRLKPKPDGGPHPSIGS